MRKLTKTQIEDLPSAKLLMVLNPDLELTAYALKLFFIILQQEINYDGQCKLNTESLARESSMAQGTVVKVKRELVSKGLITIEKYKSELNGHDGDSIHTYMTDDELFKTFRLLSRGSSNEATD